MNTNGLATLSGRTPALSEFARIETPETAQDVADLLAQSAFSGTSVVPIGGGGALQLGNLADRDAIGLSTRRLNQVLDYQPTDMTLSVGAGATLAAVQDELGSNGQALPIEAVDPSSSTIGGLLATALSGPRRYGAGTLRDVLIGISVAYPDGSVGKAGGLVVKNVSGFDMMRLHYGALGSLGVIVSANFKVLPAIRDEFSVRWQVQSHADLSSLVEQLRAPAVRPTALIASKADGAWTVMARYEGRPGGLRAVAQALGAFKIDASRLEQSESAAQWQDEMASRSFSSPGEVRVRVGCLPASTVSTVETALMLLEKFGIQPDHIAVEPGVGLFVLSWASQSAETDAGCVTSLRELQGVASCTILTAPDELKLKLDVWGSEPDAIQIMRALKSEYDPAGTLNRGRFVGRI